LVSPLTGVEILMTNPPECCLQSLQRAWSLTRWHQCSSKIYNAYPA
jgi:hypothetical protein